MTSIVNFLLCLLVSVHFAKCDLEPLFEKCCTLGKNKTLEPQKCESKIPTSIPEVSVEHQDFCLQVADLCCIQHLRENACTNGIQVAKKNTTCSIANKTDEEITNKHCCESCKLGMIAKSMSMGCKPNNFTFTYSGQKVYETCYKEYTPNTTTRNSQAEEQVHTCDLHPGKVCSQISVPVGDGYRCQCRRGFVLEYDDKSCKADNSAKRCQENKCSQSCSFDEKGVNCSCNPGFKLSADKKTCNDINECNLETNDCNTTGRNCTNIEGGYQCFCHSGYRYNTTQTKCLDIDECSETNSCNKTSQTCSNTPGSYHCNPKVPCPNGNILDNQTKKCTPRKTSVSSSSGDKIKIVIDKCNGKCDKKKGTCSYTKKGYDCVKKTRNLKNKSRHFL